MKTMIDMMSLSEFPGHEPRLCEICEHRQAVVFVVARNEIQTARAHACLTCFELAEVDGLETEPAWPNVESAEAHQLVRGW